MFAAQSAALVAENGALRSLERRLERDRLTHGTLTEEKEARLAETTKVGGSMRESERERASVILISNVTLQRHTATLHERNSA